MSGEAKNVAGDIIEKLLANSRIVIFTDQSRKTYIAPEGNGNEVYEIISDDFEEWLIGTCYETLDGYVPSSPTVKQVQRVLSAKAKRSDKQYKLEMNITRHRNAIMYDLGKGAIRITDKQWKLVKNPPIVFRKPIGQLQQVKPKRGGDVRVLLKFMNVNNESEQILLLCYVITLFVPGILYPALVLHGTQGAGKSVLMQFIKSLVDHSELDTGLSIPKDEDALALNALHNYILFYDNLSTMSEKISDALCKAVTNGAFTTRELFHTTKVFNFKFTRPVILNGLNQIIAKGDLLDRSLTMQLERITADNRKEPGVLRAEFEEAKPYILGAIFDTIIQAQAVYDTVHPDSSSRMMEFDHWGCAIAEVLGYGEERFKQARYENKLLQHGHAIEASPVGQAVVDFMRDRSNWSGTPSELYASLEPIWFRLRLDKPKDAPRLSKALNTLMPNLLAKGIAVTMTRGDQRNITLTKTTDATDNTDGKIG